LETCVFKGKNTFFTLFWGGFIPPKTKAFYIHKKLLRWQKVKCKDAKLRFNKLNFLLFLKFEVFLKKN